MAEPPAIAPDVDATASRRAAILAAATGVFLRYGFKKTSMDDVARAAGLSRQGLYLHFTTKELLFKAALLYVVAAVGESARTALARADLDVEECLLGMFESVHGHAIGQAGAEHLDELLATSVQLVGPVFEALERELTAGVSRLLVDRGVARRWAGEGVSAEELAMHLFATSHGVKHQVTAPSAYRERMRVAVRIVCRGAVR